MNIYVSVLGFFISEEDKSEVDGVIEHPLMARKERTNVFWVSYMDGLQRVFMVTQSSKIARLATQVSLQMSHVRNCSGLKRGS